MPQHQYLVPFAYVIKDDNYADPGFVLVNAANKKNAYNQAVIQIDELAKEKDGLDYVFSSFWVSNPEDTNIPENLKESDEEGYVLGRPIRITGLLIKLHLKQTIWTNCLKKP